ncbi:MAG: tetratricopeptide repeat protein [Candidatus Omnitrophota bacterium]
MPIKHTRTLSIILIAFLGFVIYINSLGGDFMWDDFHLVHNNTHIKSWSNLIKIFTGSIGTGAGRTYHMYRPIQSLTYMIDYTFWKLNVVGYHLGNVFWHIVVALCIYWLISILYRKEFLSLVTSLIYVVHPLHTEAIAYIAGRADCLAAAFSLLTFIYYIKDNSKPSPRLFIMSLLCYALAILSKEQGMLLPPLFLLYSYVFKKKVDFRKIAAFAALTIGYAVLRVTALSGLLKDIINETTVFDRLPGFFVSITNYVRLLFLPFNLHMEYGEKLFPLSDPRAIIGILIVVVSFTIAIIKRNKNNLILFSVGWFFVTLLPYSNVVAINAYMAEHWVYVPSIGFFLLLASGLNHIYNIKKLKPLAVALIVGLLVFYSSIAIKQNSYWSNPMKFYHRQLEFVRDSEVVYNNLGVLYAKKSEWEKAIQYFKDSINVRYSYSDPYFNLGKAYSELGKYRDAISYYQSGLKFSKDMVAVSNYHKIGYLYSELGMYDKALEYLKKSVEADPNYGEGYIALAIMYYNAKEYRLAKNFYSKAKALGFSNNDLEMALKGVE